jgi:putative endonuclease
MKQYYIYIMANLSRTLYVGVTSDLEGRVFQHKKKLFPGFTAKYNIDQLVYFETTENVRAAIAREKQIKGWLRQKKIALIESVNPGWMDLSILPDSTKSSGEILRCAQNDRRTFSKAKRESDI